MAGSQGPSTISLLHSPSFFSLDQRDQRPIGVGKDFKGVINLLDDVDNIPADLKDRYKELHASLTETAVSADDKNMYRRSESPTGAPSR